MRNIYPIIIMAQILLGIITACSEKQHYDLISPDGNLRMSFFQTNDGRILYSFEADGHILIDSSRLGFRTTSGETLLSGNWKIEKTEYREVDQVWNPLWGKRKTVPDRFTELILLLTTNVPSPVTKMQIKARVYDDGIAFQYIMPSDQNDSIHTSAELTGFNFADNYMAWFYNKTMLLDYSFLNQPFGLAAIQNR